MNLHLDGLTGKIDIGRRDNENWRQCAIAVHARGFSAEFVTSILDEELQDFLSQIEVALAGLGQPASITFRAIEDGFAFEIELDRHGHVEGKYEFRGGWPGPLLSGSFSADQTHLQTWAKELRSSLSH